MSSSNMPSLEETIIYFNNPILHIRNKGQASNSHTHLSQCFLEHSYLISGYALDYLKK